MHLTGTSPVQRTQVHKKRWHSFQEVLAHICICSSKEGVTLERHRTRKQRKALGYFSASTGHDQYVRFDVHSFQRRMINPWDLWIIMNFKTFFEILWLMLREWLCGGATFKESLEHMRSLYCACECALMHLHTRTRACTCSSSEVDSCFKQL